MDNVRLRVYVFMGSALCGKSLLFCPLPCPVWFSTNYWECCPWKHEIFATGGLPIEMSLSQVGRAFSFNKTPSKMKRAVSSMMSPRFIALNQHFRAQPMLRSCDSFSYQIGLLMLRTAPRLLVTESATLGRTPVYTPHQGLRELRLEVCLVFFCLDNVWQCLTIFVLIFSRISG